MNEREEVAEIAMQIIANAGEARGKVHEALEACIKKDFEKAKKLMEEANEYIINANRITHHLLSKEAKGERVLITLLLTHALDILMIAIVERDLANKIMRLIMSQS
ncbi:MAG: PTS lactose/cellobiose transporter subunit IIA [Thermoprotei archaeon]|nr:MAG: PTS lactose/cellobiose transporter subunit IIA [Thermoprotei archaeon]